MRGVQEILAEIELCCDRLRGRMEINSEVVRLEDCVSKLKKFILSEHENCEHVLVPYRREMNLQNPEVPHNSSVYIARCDLCGAVK